MNDENTITLSNNRCKNCYKCIRNCPVKAIYFKSNKTEIAHNRCVACGKCFIICPQKNKKIPNSILKIKKHIENNNKTIVSLDPTFVGYFGNNHTKLVSALKKLGFNYIEETSVAIDILYDEYRKAYNQNKQKYYITSSCSGINQLAQKYYPEINNYLLAVDLPMVIHGKMLKEKYGCESKVIYLGPCTAAKMERNNAKGIIDAVLTFHELEDWMFSSNIRLKELQEGPINIAGSKEAKAFSIDGFIDIKKDLEAKTNYIKVNGLDNTKELFISIMNNELDSAFIEVNFCRNGCIQGPSFNQCEINLFTRKKQISEYSRSTSDTKIMDNKNLTNGFKRVFHNKKVYNLQPSKIELSKILREMGKYKESDELNCGTCGYDTCRDKAIAIFNDMDKGDMCLPYIRNKSETISNLIFENSPNYILLVNRDLKIVSINPAAINCLNIDKQLDIQFHLPSILESTDYLNVFINKESICGKKIKLKEQNLTVIQNLLYIKEQDAILAILNDITKEEEKEKELIEVKKNTDEMVQKVIAKQMKIAQEICSLLGESTAETRIALKKFLDITLEKSGDN